MTDLVRLQEILNVSFMDLSLLEQALVHRSYLNENPDSVLPSNERLEFLGDALLGFVVAQRLYVEYPHLSEGEMSRLRSAIVCRETLAHLASSLGLGEYLRLGRGEEASGGRKRESNLACAFEAVVGAILVDRGFAAARDFILRFLDAELETAVEETLAKDYKSRLQEIVQAREQKTPSYRIVETTGPEHEKKFTVEVLVGDLVMGRGTGRSKRVAEREAARVALERLSS